jgi:XTP/dITP diphosphohydrolase
MLDGVVATRNRGKFAEIKEGLKGLGLNLLPLPEGPAKDGPEEDGDSYLENALKKALTYARILHSVVVADDSGLEVDALGGRPGLFSSRYSGGTDFDNIQKLLRELADVRWERRTARFRCAFAVAIASGNHITAEGECFGFITHQPKGQMGFGYDPIFYHPSIKQTFGECTPETKMSLSHRGQALEKLRAELPSFLGNNVEET